MTGRLGGKVAFITGAARGQGRAHAVRMASEGADIIAVDIAGTLPDCVPYDPATPDDLAETPEDFRDVIDVNVTGTWNTVMAGAQKIIDGGRGGSIVLISSAAGIKMQPFMVHYTASKHAVTGMARAFAAELGRYSIRVNSWRKCSRRFSTTALPSLRTLPTRCAGWPVRNRRCYGCFNLDRPGNDAVLSQPMKRTIDSATAAGLSDPSISTVTVTVACTAPSS
jgi:NAD(P)-dependent dehydrogenase (short-subunit alcohol dehydrogenase family)